MASISNTAPPAAPSDADVRFAKSQSTTARTRRPSIGGGGMSRGSSPVPTIINALPLGVPVSSPIQPAASSSSQRPRDRYDNPVGSRPPDAPIDYRSQRPSYIIDNKFPSIFDYSQLHHIRDVTITQFILLRHRSIPIFIGVLCGIVMSISILVMLYMYTAQYSDQLDDLFSTDDVQGLHNIVFFNGIVMMFVSMYLIMNAGMFVRHQWVIYIVGTIHVILGIFISVRYYVLSK